MGILPFIIIFCLDNLFFQTLNSLSVETHSLCIQWTKSESSFVFLHQGLLCGAKIPFGNAQATLKELGLIHLIVVSGAHLIFVSQLLLEIWPRKSRQFSHLIWWLLFIYTLATQLQPPVLRAFLFCTLQMLADKDRMNWSRIQIHLLSCFATLFINPDWIHSLSFLMSFSAAMVLAIEFRSKTIQQMCIYLILLLPMTKLGITHPISILLNLIIAPFIGFFILPMTLWGQFFPSVLALVDSFWIVFFEFAQKHQPPPIPHFQFPLLPTSLNLLLYLWIAVKLDRYQSKKIRQEIANAKYL
jgi:ComEC/Rec2-related protein